MTEMTDSESNIEKKYDYDDFENQISPEQWHKSIQIPEKIL